MLNSRLMEALGPIAPTQADEYVQDDLGPVDTYIVFNYNSYPADFGDDAPGHEVYSVQVHLFCPNKANSLPMRQEIKTALVTAGFTWPAYTNASDKDGQHHVFECQTARGVT